MHYKLLFSLVFYLASGVLSVASAFQPATTAVTSSINVDSSKIQLGAVKAAVMDLDSGKVLYSKYADWVTPIASITKVMTAMVVLDSDQKLSEMVVIPKPVLCV